jgi:hypothetical protein
MFNAIIEPIQILTFASQLNRYKRREQMIPASYLFRDIYDQRWGNPRDMEPPMDPPLPQPGKGKGYFIRIYGFISLRFSHLQKYKRLHGFPCRRDVHPGELVR